MSEKKKNLKQARECLAAKNFREAIQSCKAVLKEDRTCYEAYVYIGKAAYHLGEFEQITWIELQSYQQLFTLAMWQAEVAYQKATEINDKAAQGWQGLSELYHDTQQWVKAAETDQTLVDLAHRGDASLAAKLPYLARRLGEAHKAAGQLEEAEVALRDVLRHQLPLEEKLQVLALLADVQLKEDSAELEVKVQQRLQEQLQAAGGDTSKVCEDAVRFSVVSEAADEAMELDCDHATPTLKELICSVAPTPPYVKYHDTYLRRLRQAVNVAVPGSMDRHNRRVAVLEVCRAMIDGRSAANAEVGMGCASPYAYETALRLLEIEEEIAGACLPRSSSQDLTPSRGAFSGVTSPRSGWATPTAAGLAAAVAANVSPGSFFGGSSMLNAARIGSIGGGLNESLSLMGVGTGYRSGTATPGAASFVGTGMTSLPSAGNLSGIVPTAPATPKRIMSSQRLSELVHNPMAGATAAASGTMAEQERESFSQLAAEASGVASAAATTANGTADGTPLDSITPAGSLGAFGTQTLATSLSVVGAPGGLRVSIGGGGLASRYSSQELTAASPRTSTTPRFSTTFSTAPLTPRAAQPPAAAPLLMADSEMLARKLMHAFPWNATAHVHMAMALRRRESYITSAAATIKLQCDWQGPGVTDLSCSAMALRMRAERPRQQARRAWLANLMAKGLERGAPVVAGMIGLAELRMEAGDAHGALEAAKRGLKFVFDRSKIAKERARHAALVLNLLAAQALLGTGQVTDAGRIFVRLAQRVSEGEIAFGSEAVGMPATSIRQQAIRGLAQVALAQEDTCQALHHYGELVSKALMGRGSAEHWAYAEYGWLLFQEGNADAGRYQLETALDVLYRQTGGHNMEVVAADYHFKLGRIYWACGGNYKTEREYCHAHLLDAAAEEGPQQAGAFEWLGHWYSQVAGDELRARKCYQRALALDPTLEGAGVALCSQLHTAPAEGTDAGTSGIQLELQLLQEILIRAPDAQWARARLARLQLQMGLYEEAVSSHQAAIRAAPKSAELWEGLAASYQALGRHASALKSYTRTLELDPARPYALMSSGALEYMTGAYDTAAAKYRAALQVVPQHPAALLGLAEVLLSSACRHAAMGAAGAAAVELSQAAEVARAATTGVKAAAVPGAAAVGTADRVHTAAPATSNGSEQQHSSGMLYTTNLVTAWKLLGDILLQQHMLQPTATAACASGPAAAEEAVSAALQHLAARRHLLRDARRSYSRALRLNPAAGEVWGDVALCYYHEARLLQQQQQQSSQPSVPNTSITTARAAAVRTARGGLRLSPTSSWLWGVLAGAAEAAGDPAAAEYAYSRALALDPKAAMLWVQLGRLYSRHGSVELAEQCYEAARGAEPTLVPVWEAMAATAAQSGSSAGSASAAAAADHAIGLGGGPESWLGYTTAGLRGLVPHDNSLLLACACKASADLPLLLPAHAALAAAMEACRQYTSAIAALQYCLALLRSRQQQGPEGLAALGMAGLGQDTISPTYRILLLQPLGLGGPGDTVGSPETVTAALQTALARNLCLSGRHQEAVDLYGQLESQGALGAGSLRLNTYSWLCYGYAAQQIGQADMCSRVLERAAAEAADDQDKLHAVMALLQHHLQSGALEGGFSLLLQHLPQISCSNAALAQAGMKLWLSLLVAAAAAGQHDVQAQVEEVMRQAAHEAMSLLDWAWVECELECIHAAGQAAAGHNSQAVRQLAHAVHTCPWHMPARIRLASQALNANPRLAQSAYRACPGLLPESHTSSSSSNAMPAFQQQQPQQAAQYPGQQPELDGSVLGQELAASEVLAAASCRAAALSGQVAAAVAAKAGREVCRLTRLVHALPYSPDLWYCLALAAVLRAVGSGQAAHYRFARKCCSSALREINGLTNRQEQQQQGARTQHKQPTSSLSSSSSLECCDSSQLLECKVQLMVAMSECYQHSRLPGCHDNAHEWAMDALAVAMAGGGVGSAAAHRQVGRMLAYEGMLTEAEMALRQAAAASARGSAEAVLELSTLLASQGRHQEAAQLLHGVWQQAAAAAAGTGAADGSSTAASGPGPHFVEVAALEEALRLAELGQWDAARSAAAAGLRLAIAAGDAAPAAAELVTASVALQAAAAAPPESSRNLILEARWAASSAAKSGMALPGTVGSAAAGVGAAVLAQVELARGKPERAYDAIGMSIGTWVDQAVPAQVLATAGELTGQVTDCAVAVHTAPWDRAGWERLNLAAAARG